MVYGALAVSLNFRQIWIHVGNGQRGTFELFVALALLSMSVPAEHRWMRWCRSAFWTGAAVYVFWGAFDARLVRDALVAPIA
jgi:hypothetical protein